MRITSISEKERMEIRRVIIVLILAEAAGNRCRELINIIFICSQRNRTGQMAWPAAGKWLKV